MSDIGPELPEDEALAAEHALGVLSESERAEAPRLYRLLNEIRDAIRAGETDIAKLEKSAIATLDGAGWKTDYVAVRQQSDLAPATPGKA